MSRFRGDLPPKAHWLSQKKRPGQPDSSENIDSPAEEGKLVAGSEDTIVDTGLPAGLLLRFMAFLLDMLLFVGALFALNSVLHLIGFGNSSVDSILKIFLQGGFDAEAPPLDLSSAGQIQELILIVIIGLGFVVYHSLFEGSPLRATPGKLAFGLFVTDCNSAACSHGRCFARNLSKLLSGITLGVGFLMAGFSVKNQALHDLVTQTLVVRKRTLEMGHVVLATCFVIFSYLTVSLIAKQTLPQPEEVLVSSNLQVIPLAQPLKSSRIIPPEEGTLGYLKVGKDRRPFKSMFIRLQDPMLIKGGFQSSQYFLSNPKKLEILFFPRDVPQEQRIQLRNVGNLFTEAAAIVGDAPLLLLEMLVPQQIESCQVEQFPQGAATFSAQKPAVPGELISKPAIIRFNPVALFEKGSLNIQCKDLRPGAKIFLSLIDEASLDSAETEAGDSAEKEVVWNIRGEEEIHPFYSLDSVHYDSFVDSLAVWRIQEKVLELAFFPQQLTLSEKEALAKEGAFETLGAAGPDLTIRIPFSRKLKRINADNVLNGFTVKVFSRKDAAIYFSGAEGSFSFDMPPGTEPQTLSGMLKPGQRMIGRLDGSHVFSLKNGAVEFSWLLSFNAEVIVYRGK